MKLFSGINWNEFRKGYRESEKETMEDERFAQEQAMRDLQYENLLNSIEAEKKAAPLRLSLLGDRAAASRELTPLQIEQARRADELAALSQPGAVAGARFRSESVGALTDILDPRVLAAAKASTITSRSELERLGLEGAIQREPARQALLDDTLGLQGQQLASQKSLLPAQTSLTSAQLGAAQALLPVQTDVATQRLRAESELIPQRTALQGAQLAGQRDLLPAQLEAQRQILVDSAALRPQQFQLAAQSLTSQITDLDRRAQANGILDRITNLQQFMTNRDAVSTAAQEQGVTPETVMRMTDAQIRQLAGAFMSATGNITSQYQTGLMTPESYNQALARAGRVNPDGTPVTRPSGATGGAAAAPRPNPLLSPPAAPAPAASTNAASAAPKTAPTAPVAPAPNLLPTPEQIQRQAEARKESDKIKERQRAAVEALGPAPKIPDGVPDDEVKAIQKGVKWGDYTDETLKAIIGSANYSKAQVAAAQQELYRRRVEKAKQQAASPQTANELIQSIFNWRP